MFDPSILFTPEGRADPFPIYRRLRAQQPVSRAVEPRGFPVWLVARHADGAEVLRDGRLVKDRRHLPPETLAQYAPLIEPLDVLSRHMLASDPPDHGRLRALVSRAFTPQRIEGLRPRVVEIAEELLDARAHAGRMDLLADFAFPLPVTVIAELLGVPATDRDRFRTWTTALVATPEDDEGSARQRAAAGELAAYLREIIAARRAEPRGDLVSALAAEEEAGDRLHGEELVGMLFLLLVAGHETTVNLIANGALALMEHPDQREVLAARPEAMGTAVEEMLRFCGPVKHATPRWTPAPMTIAGVEVPAWALVVPLLLSAGRDEAVFAEPDRFDVLRSPNRHLAFGAGMHFCLGAPLARLEAQVALGAMLRRLPEMRLAIARNELAWSTAFLFHAVLRMPVGFRAAPVVTGFSTRTG